MTRSLGFLLCMLAGTLGDAERTRAGRAEHERLTAAEIGAAPVLPGTKDKPLP